MPTQLAGILLDIDGTLVDSNDANARAWMEALVAHGFEINYIKLREAVGMGGDNLLPNLAHLEAESEQGKAIVKMRGDVLKSKYLPDLKAFPQVKELLTRFRSNGLKLVVATSAKSDEAEALLKLTGASDLIDEIATTEDAESSKPNPDILQAALKKSGLSADAVIMLGDTPYDVEAAQKAGIGCIGVRCGGWAAPDLHGALAVYNDPADLLAHYDESPLCR
ncbi:MAG: HAD family hydrolase [Janthinobacterium lividum]